MSEAVLVTGLTGFIAKHVTAQLLERGYRVRGTVRDPEKGLAFAATMEAKGLPVERLSVVRLILKGAYPAVPPVAFPIVDVRDV